MHLSPFINFRGFFDCTYLDNSKMRELRTKLNLSKGELARRVGVSRQTVNMIENGGYNPTVELCIRICKELGVTLNDLFWR